MNTIKTILGLLLVLFTISSCSKDDDSSFTVSNEIVIPDANFEQALIDLGIDTDGLNGSILKTDAEAVTSLNVNFEGIANLQGIEGFVNLQNLYCQNNQLSTLDVGGLSNLQILNCGNNTIASLDLSLNTNLTELRCFNNQLTSLDVGDLSSLGILNCNENNIASLDLSFNINLQDLNCRNNQLTSLGVSDLLSLQNINCSNNNIIELDLSNNTALEDILVGNNDLERLNLKNGNNQFIDDLEVYNNPNLLCIQVDNASYSTLIWSDNVDAQVSFSTNCN